jgi:hypothetical protein
MLMTEPLLALGCSCSGAGQCRLHYWGLDSAAAGRSMGDGRQGSAGQRVRLPGQHGHVPDDGALQGEAIEIQSHVVLVYWTVLPLQSVAMPLLYSLYLRS